MHPTFFHNVPPYHVRISNSGTEHGIHSCSPSPIHCVSTVCESSVRTACLHPGLLASDASDHCDACVALCQKQQLFDLVLLSILLSVLGMPLLYPQVTSARSSHPGCRLDFNDTFKSSVGPLGLASHSCYQYIVPNCKCQGTIDTPCCTEQDRWCKVYNECDVSSAEPCFATSCACFA